MCCWCPSSPPLMKVNVHAAIDLQSYTYTHACISLHVATLTANLKTPRTIASIWTMRSPERPVNDRKLPPANAYIEAAMQITTVWTNIQCSNHAFKRAGCQTVNLKTGFSARCSTIQKGQALTTVVSAFLSTF